MDADNLSLVASDWTSKYQEDGPEAMKQLVNFFLRVSGSTRNLTIALTNMVLSAADVSNLLQVMISKTRIPLQRHCHRFKKFSKRFAHLSQNI